MRWAQVIAEVNAVRAAALLPKNPYNWLVTTFSEALEMRLLYRVQIKMHTMAKCACCNNIDLLLWSTY